MLLALALCGCSRPAPNVLLVTLDTTRADHIGCYGFPLARTPRLDRLAREGVRCANATTAAPITLPSHSTILTGLYPPAHGVRDNGTYALGDDAV
ncbi:MAG TPA: sulfatase-like hydrolase/transferase, partial [Thermoanaerobaculia bacterium]